MNINYKMPNRIRKLMNKEFFKTFKDKLDEIFKIEDDLKNNIFHYFMLEGTCGFVEAFNYACDNHTYPPNGVGIKRYYKKLDCYDSDLFDDYLVEYMCKALRIPEPTEKDYADYFDCDNYDNVLYPEDEYGVTWTYEITQHKSCKHYKKVFIN